MITLPVGGLPSTAKTRIELKNVKLKVKLKNVKGAERKYYASGGQGTQMTPIILF